MLRVELEHAQVVRDRTRMIAELFLADGRSLHVELRREHRVLDVLDLLLVDLRERVVVGADHRDPREVVLRRLARGVLRESARVRLEGAPEVVERELVQLRDPVEELDPAVGRARVARLDLVDADQLVVLARVAIDRLQDLRDEQLVLLVADELLESRERRLVRGVALEDLAVPFDRRVGHAHPRLAQLGEPQHQRDLLVRVLRHGELALHVVRQVGPHVLARVEIVER